MHRKWRPLLCSKLRFEYAAENRCIERERESGKLHSLYFIRRFNFGMSLGRLNFFFDFEP